MRVVFEFMLFEAGAFFGLFVAALLNAARAGQEITMPNFLRCNRAAQSCAPNWKPCSRTSLH